MNYTLTIVEACGAEMHENKIIGNKFTCIAYEIMHRIFYGKKLKKKGVLAMYFIEPTTLTDCIFIHKQKQ